MKPHHQHEGTVLVWFIWFIAAVLLYVLLWIHGTPEERRMECQNRCIDAGAPQFTINRGCSCVWSTKP